MPGANSPARPYRSALRQRQAEQTRQRVVEAAVALFDRQDYRATTLAQIAQTAGVSIETVQKHGPKAALLQAAVELASFGVEGATDFFTTDHGLALLRVRDADAFAAVLGDTMLAINRPTTGIWMTIVGAARGDQVLSGHHARMLALIRGQVANVARHLADRGWLRRDVPFDDLVEALCIITCVETYVRFVQLDGLSDEDYKAFVTRTVRDTILVS